MREGTEHEPEGSLAALRALPDAELIARLRAGEQLAFEPVMRRYNRRMFRAARAIVLSDAEAEEVVQEAYVRAYLHLGDLRAVEGLGAWLTRIAINEARMYRRRSGAREVSTLPDEVEALEEDGMPLDRPADATPEQDAASAQLGAVLERCIDRLPGRYRVAFVLREVEQLSVAETAAVLKIPPDTVKTRVFRARRLLRRALTDQLDRATREAYLFGGQRCDAIVATVFQRLSAAAGALGPDGRSH